MTAANNITNFKPFKLNEIQVPPNLVVNLSENLIEDAGRHMFGYDGILLFGTAFIQGKRLCFTTAMPILTLIEVAGKDRAKRGDTVKEVKKHPNRPTVPSQSKAIRDYYMDTACSDLKWILPAFTLNFGCENSKSSDEDRPSATLLIYAADKEENTVSNGWPAVFRLPRNVRMDTTDGAHRLEQAIQINKDLIDDPDKRELFVRNAVDVKIVFETNPDDAHQDFADCAKAKPIAASLVATYDVRNHYNSAALALTQAVPFLSHYVDATASNINLSAGSLKIWSLSAIRGFVTAVSTRWDTTIGLGDGAPSPTLVEKLNDAPAFWEALIRHLPQLKTLDLAREDSARTETPATFRNRRGGDIALRGVGTAMFALAFLYAKKTGMSFDEVASGLAKVDWHVLLCERSELPNPKTPEGRLTFEREVRKNIVPTWASMIVTGESRYRIGAGLDDAVSAWQKIEAEQFTVATAQAAE